MNWDLQDKSWSAGPRLPIVTDQFCKKLIFPPADEARPIEKKTVNVKVNNDSRNNFID